MSKEAKVVVSGLPEDVVLNILRRLPIKSLIRFTCVSKRWRSIIISDSHFAKSTFEVASRTRTLRQRLLVASHPRGELGPSGYALEPWIFQCLGDLGMPCFRGKSLTVPQEVKVAKGLLASCNGLVVVGKTTRCTFTNLSVWNPSTGFVRQIPNPELLSVEKMRISTVRSGFGHVMATDEYKLVFFVPEDFTVHIFSTGDGSWKVIRATHLKFPVYYYTSILVLNGACHWISNENGAPVGISAFDLGEEEFRELPLPRALMPNNDEMNWRRIETVVLIGGCLCVWSQDAYGHSEFWKMKEYGDPKSWVKMFQFRVNDLPAVFTSIDEVLHWSPVFVTEGGSVVIRFRREEFVRIECHIEEKPVCSSRYNIAEAMGHSCLYASMVYDETLLSVS